MGFSVTWRAVGASVVGTSHLSADRPCEDCHQVGNGGADEEVFFIVVADGAGSASEGLLGAEIAVVETRQYCLRAFQDGVTLDERFARECAASVREKLINEAEYLRLLPRDVACTYLVLVAASDAAVAFQVGDGGIVVDSGSGLELAIVSEEGEYANQTRFLSDEDSLQRLTVRAYSSPLQCAAVFSDGLQRLALDLTKGEPHEPFFRPFFTTLREVREDQVPALQPLLERFLSSTPVNERTDDDKTLVLAVRTRPEPCAAPS
jgi:hypothetical protein